jgi:hypothetical protein
LQRFILGALLRMRMHPCSFPVPRALFDIQDETSRIPLASEQHTSLNCSYPHIGEVFDVCAPVCSSTFQIQSAGVILKGKELVFVSGLPISHGFHSTGSFIFDNGNTIAFECTTVYTSSHGNALIKLSLASEGVVLRFTEKSFHHNLLFAYFGISTKTSSLSGIGGQLMVKLVGLSQVFSHRRVLGALELMMPPYVVSVIKSVPSALDPPSIVVDLDVYLSAPHHCSGTFDPPSGGKVSSFCCRSLHRALGHRTPGLDNGRLGCTARFLVVAQSL